MTLHIQSPEIFLHFSSDANNSCGKEAYFKKKGPSIIDDLQDLNTLEPDLDTYLYIWHEGEYFCSVCHSKKVCYFLKKSQGQNKLLFFSIADFIAF